MPTEQRDDSWKPDGWDSWPQPRRTLWRREQQIERMERLANHDPARAATVETWLPRLRAEASELRAVLMVDGD